MKKQKINNQEQDEITSKDVAVLFKRQHKNILKAIDDLKFSEEFKKANYSESTYTCYDVQPAGIKYRMVVMTPKGRALLVAGFTGVQAANIKEKHYKELGLSDLEKSDFEGAFYVNRVKDEGFQKTKVRPTKKVDVVDCGYKNMTDRESENQFIFKPSNPEAEMEQSKEAKINIQNINGELMTSSVNVSIMFKKHHKHVLEAIEKLDCSEEFKGSNFRLSYYTSDIGNNPDRKYKRYLMTKDGFTFLAFGYKGKKVAKFKEDYIAEFNRMAEEIVRLQNELAQKQTRPRELTRSELIKFAYEADQSSIKANKQLAIAHIKIEEDKSKVDFFDHVSKAKGLYSVGEAAKILGHSGRNNLFQWLRDQKIFMGKVPYQRYINKNYFTVQLTKHAGHVQSQSFVTHKGLIWLQKKFKKGQNAG